MTPFNMNQFTNSDKQFMRRALDLAHHAEEQGEVPVGAVVVFDNKIIGEGWNQPISTNDPSAHAEIIALRQAAQHQNNYRLPGAILYVTLESCMMCATAMIHARIERLVFAAFDPKTGAAGSQIDIFNQPFVNHKVLCEKGLLKEESERLLKDFFKKKR